MNILSKFSDRDALFDLLFSVALPFALSSLILVFLWQPGYVFYGDSEPLTSKSIISLLSTWTSQSSNNGYFLLPEVPLLMVLTSFFGAVAPKLYFIVVVALPGTSMYFASKSLLAEWKLVETRSMLILSATFSAMFYMLAFANPGWFFEWTLSWNYIALPLIFTTYEIAVRRQTFRIVIAFGLATVLASAFPNWFFLLLPLLVLFTIIEVARGPRERKILYAAYCLIASISFNAFWWLPTLLGYLQHGFGAFSNYTTSNLISFSGLQYLSFYKLEDILMFGQPTYYLFHTFPQNWTLLNIFVIISAFLSVLLARNKYTLSLALASIITIFLANGANPPFGYIYYLLADSFSYGLGAILRNPTFFMLPLTLIYSVMIAVTISHLDKVIIKVMAVIQIIKRHAKDVLVFSAHLPRRPTIVQAFSVGILSTLVLTPVISGTFINLNVFTYPYYSPRQIPQAYNDAMGFLSSQKGTFNVMWLPLGGAYTEWNRSDDVQTNFPASISSLPQTPPNYIYPYLTETHFLGKLLSITNTRYLIFHNDTIQGSWGVQLSNNQILSILLNQSDLSLVWHEGFVYIFENEEPSSPFFTPNLMYVIGDIPYPFLLNEHWSPTSLAVTNSSSAEALNASSIVLLSNSTVSQLAKMLGISESSATNLLSNFKGALGWEANAADVSTMKLPTGGYPLGTNITQLAGHSITSVVNGTDYFSLSSPAIFKAGEPINITIRYKVPTWLTSLYNEYHGFNIYFSPTLSLLPSNATSIYQQFYQMFPSSFTNFLNNDTGYVTFNKNISGAPAVLPQFTGQFNIVLWVYTSGFSQQGPYLNLGTFYSPTSGSWKAYSTDGQESLVLVNSSTQVRVYAPLTSQYTLGLRQQGLRSLKVDDLTLQLNGSQDWSYIRLPLTYGFHTLTLTNLASTPSEVNEILLYNRITSVQNFFQSNASLRIENFQQISNTEWKVSLAPGNTKLLAFTNSYDPLWRSTGMGINQIQIFNGLMASNFYASVTGTINGYLLNSDFTSLTFDYELQNYFITSSVISLVSVSLALVGVVFGHQLRRYFTSIKHRFLNKLWRVR